MKLKKYKIDEISPMPNNPRVLVRKQSLEMSLSEFGYVEPIVVNKRTKHIVGGNQRYEILKEKGVQEIEAVEVDLSESEEKALNLALNKISGDWDIPKLKDLLLEIDTGEFDISITGFTEEEIKDLLTIPDVEEYQDQGQQDLPEKMYVLIVMPEEKGKVEEYLNNRAISYHEATFSRKK